jgi:hypothetical protein
MIRGYTTIEQSQKLLELGLNIDSADMYYGYKKEKPELLPFADTDVESLCLPCWSLSALLDMMPNIRSEHGVIRCKMDKEAKSIFPYMFYYLTIHSTSFHEAPVDAAFEMICWLIEKDYIKTK